MKIVRVIARLNVGGPAKHVVWLTQGLQSQECDSVLVAGTVPPGEEDMGYFAETMGVAPVFVPEMSREISPKDLLTIWKLYLLFKREQPDIVHTHTAKAGTVGRLAGLLYRWFTPQVLLGRPRKCKFVHTYHGHIFHSYYGPLKTRAFLTVEKILGRLGTDRIVVISEQQRAEINETFGVGHADKFRVIPLGLDLGVFQDWQSRRHVLRQQLNLAPEDILVGIVGRLTEVKNHKLFLNSISAFKKKFSSGFQKVLFVVVGDGSLRQELEQQAAALGLRDDVVFLGSRRDMENIYPAFDIAALTSLNEGTPLTLIEAMANARPVVSTLVGGVVDLLGRSVATGVEDGYAVCERGIGVKPDTSEAFASALAHLIGDEGLRREIGDAGLQFVLSRYSKDRLLDDVKQLYAALHADPRQKVRAHPTEQRFESRS
ncbi:MAG TPA: glycosyltransferase [Pyrinomonadaceae bacterium]